jgi:hypothetical protein
MAEMPWRPVVYVPTNLTVRFDAEVFQAEDPRSWCESKAADVLGSGAKRRHIQRLAATLMKYSQTLQDLNGRGVPTVAALFFWPDFTVQRATAEVYIVTDNHADGPITLARARELTGTNKDSLGETETTEVGIPAGPAFRAHRFRKLWGALAPHNVTEEVSWFIWPVGSSATVVITVSWFERMFSEAGINIADDMARNFRVEPFV